MTLEERVEDAIVARFFEPSILMQPHTVFDSNTNTPRMEVVPTEVPSPLSVVAQAIYEQAKPDIIRAVMERLDIDAIVEQWAPIIAKDVVTKLQTPPDRWLAKPSPSEREKMLTKVYAQVAEEFGRQCVEHLKATGGLLAVLDA